MKDQLKSLYVDQPLWAEPIKVDDFIVAVGKNKTNSVYHVAEARNKTRENKRSRRCYLKVLLSDLPTALSREPDQSLIPMTWYKRAKKSG